jgi:hypothetical protein
MGATNANPLASWTGLLENGATRCWEVAQPLPDDWRERVLAKLAEIRSGDLDDLLSAAEKVSSKLDAPRVYALQMLCLSSPSRQASLEKPTAFRVWATSRWDAHSTMTPGRALQRRSNCSPSFQNRTPLERHIADSHVLLPKPTRGSPMSSLQSARGNKSNAMI